MYGANASTSGVRAKIQRAGKFMSGMIMPNIGAFIAWGLITALFIPTGWLPNEHLSKLVGPMITYLLPLLIGYTGGKTIGGVRGGVVGAIATAGIIVGASVPMFIGAMIAGPIGGLAIKKFDEAIDGYVPVGFEMLINNFSSGIIGMALALLAYAIVGPAINGLVIIAQNGMETIVDAGFLPLTSLLIEPCKILFLNNAINHGIFTPLGAAQVAETGKSVYLLLETNPGPGLGILLAYFVFGKGSVKDSTPGAMIIHFLGGIHEIYFPYVLMHPVLLLAVLGGGIAGVTTMVLTNSGLVAAASPGSIFAIMAVAPKGGHLPILLGITIATAVSFAIASIFVKRISAREEDMAASLEQAKSAMKDMKDNWKEGGVKVSKIAFACDAGMGSSAMGANRLKKKLKAAGLDVDVVHCPVDQVDADAELVVCQENLAERVRMSAPGKKIVTINNFVNAPEYDEIVVMLSGK